MVLKIVEAGIILGLLYFVGNVALVGVFALLARFSLASELAAFHPEESEDDL